MRHGTPKIKANPTHHGAICFLIIAIPAIIQAVNWHRLYSNRGVNQIAAASDSNAVWIALGSSPESTNPFANARKPEMKASKEVPNTPSTVTNIPVLADRSAIFCPMKIKVATKNGEPMDMRTPSGALTQLRLPGSVPIPIALTKAAINQNIGPTRARTGNAFFHARDQREF